MPDLRRLRIVAAGVAAIALAACSVPDEPVEIHDPYENVNRRVHTANFAVDRAVLRPASRVYGDVPQPVRRGLANFATNLDTPRYFVNDLLQGDVEDAVHNLSRFLINTIVGVGGIFNPAESFGLEPRDNDFGATLHAWGVAEGAYIELPLLGPSTERDAVGIAVDFVMNPLNQLDPKIDPKITTTANASQVLETRSSLGATIDSVLYESADSYAQSRTLYLQNRRFDLEDGTSEFFDPYEDLYGE